MDDRLGIVGMADYIGKPSPSDPSGSSKKKTKKKMKKKGGRLRSRESMSRSTEPESLEIRRQLSSAWVPEAGETEMSGYGKYPCYYEVPVPWVVTNGKMTKFDSDFQKYRLDLKRSEGFYFEKHPGTCYLTAGSINSYVSDTTQDLLPRIWEMEDYARRALEIFNKNHGEKNQFVGIVRANYELGGPWIRYYITFRATKVVAADAPKEESAVRVFQARVLFCGIRQTKEIEFCRLEQPLLSD